MILIFLTLTKLDTGVFIQLQHFVFSINKIRGTIKKKTIKKNQPSVCRWRKKDAFLQMID